MLIGAFFLGRAAQRRRDEEQSGIWLQQAVDAIFQLKEQALGGGVNEQQARQVFEAQILSPFVAQIQTLRTESVRRSTGITHIYRKSSVKPQLLCCHRFV